MKFNMKDPNFLAQAGHIALGVIGVCLPIAIYTIYFIVRYHLDIPWGWICLGGTGVMGLGYFLPKETIVDPKVEKEPFWPKGAIDCTFFLLGSLIAWGLVAGAALLALLKIGEGGR